MTGIFKVPSSWKWRRHVLGTQPASHAASSKESISPWIELEHPCMCTLVCSMLPQDFSLLVGALGRQLEARGYQYASVDGRAHDWYADRQGGGSSLASWMHNWKYGNPTVESG
ncbi:hypothetical protein Y1Q_0017251 [Alligator mississippiensis]|uniref:Uncharacterized protein n=1 Tax=Alligator mississippiensis TaxID=8496 RepID=A0A151NL18_ALLMI|nr:hypothetical protein Y1Q_0017251 [Alligator mississippiensis]